MTDSSVKCYGFFSARDAFDGVLVIIGTQDFHLLGKSVMWGQGAEGLNPKSSAFTGDV